MWWVLFFLVCAGREEEQDHRAHRSPAAVWHPCRGHQPLHGHLQEDGGRLLRSLRLLLHIHPFTRDLVTHWLGDSLADEEDPSNPVYCFCSLPVVSHSNKACWFCARRAFFVVDSLERVLLLPYDQGCTSHGRVFIVSGFLQSAKLRVTRVHCFTFWLLLLWTEGQFVFCECVKTLRAFIVLIDFVFLLSGWVQKQQ